MPKYLVFNCDKHERSFQFFAVQERLIGSRGSSVKTSAENKKIIASKHFKQKFERQNDGAEKYSCFTTKNVIR